MGDISDPITYKEAIVSPQSNFWINVMKAEMISMSQNKVWSFLDLVDGYRPIRCNWVFNTKHDAKGQVKRYKARLVAKGYSHVKPGKNSIFLKKDKTVIYVGNHKFSRSRMTKQTSPLNLSREI